MASKHIHGYSDAATALVIKLREEGLVGSRLYDRFCAVIPNRTPVSVRNKVNHLRAQRVFR